MKPLTITITAEELSPTELTDIEQSVVDHAIAATTASNAPYSHFSVGAAVRLTNGVIIRGANQENASFPLTMCAERTAIFTAQVCYPDEAITHLAICAMTDAGLSPMPVAPCGACRQVMLQVEQRYHTPMTILLYGTARVVRVPSAADLLPLSFTDDALPT